MAKYLALLSIILIPCCSFAQDMKVGFYDSGSLFENITLFNETLKFEEKFRHSYGGLIKSKVEAYESFEKELELKVLKTLPQPVMLQLHHEAVKEQEKIIQFINAHDSLISLHSYSMSDIRFNTIKNAAANFAKTKNLHLLIDLNNEAILYRAKETDALIFTDEFIEYFNSLSTEKVFAEIKALEIKINQDIYHSLHSIYPPLASPF